jgi:PAS domain S-box-containing protein
MPKILVIADKPDPRISMGTPAACPYLLKKQIADCTVMAASASDGMEKAKSELPDMIFLGAGISESDMTELCTRLKNDLVTRRIPLIVLTDSAADAQSRFKALSIGVTAFLREPVDEAELTALVHAMLRIRTAEAALRKRTYDLDKRVKEMNCLYSIPEVSDQQSLSPEELIQGIVELIPAAFQYPGVTAARAIVKGQEFRTKNFKKTEWSRRRDIILGNRSAAGFIEVAYLEKKPESDEGPFQNEEIILLNAIADRLGKIIERKQSRKKLMKLNRSLRILSACNKALAYAAVETEFIEDICRIVVEEGKYRMAWVGFCEHDKDKSILPAAQWGYEENYLNSLNLSWADNERGQGPTGTAIRTRKVCVVQHILTDPRFELWRADALRQGYASSASVPLCCEGECIGALSIYAAESNAFNADEVNLLTELAGDLAQGITALRMKAERRRSQEALRASENRYKILFDNACDAIFVHNADGQILNVNRIACERLGYTREDLLNMHLRDIHIPEDFESVSEQFRAWGSHSRIVFETAHVCRDRRIIPIEISTAAIEYEGKPAILSFARDISERKLAEQEKAGLQDQLRQSQKMEAIGTLAGGIAHDFNNILFPIIGYTEMSMDRVPRDSSEHNWLEQVLKGANRAADLVRQILAFSRKTKYERKAIQIQPVIKEVLKLLKSSLPGSIEIRQKIDSRVSRVMADPTQIYQIIMNLCTNAYHAMRKDGGVLEVILSESDDEDRVILSVRDTGYGIDPLNMEKIFDPYFTTKEPGDGTGLGLSVAKGIVEDYGGRITVESELGKGTVFHIYFPRIQQLKDDKTDSLYNLPAAGGNERILFVDDDSSVAFMANEMLTTLGYYVTVYTQSEEAFEAFQNRPSDFDIVISDSNMPKLSGIRLAEKIMKCRPDIPVVLCTGFSDANIEEKAKSIGIREIIMKPVTRSLLAETIRKVMDRI